MKKFLKILIIYSVLILVLILTLAFILAKNHNFFRNNVEKIDFLNEKDAWADSVLNSLSLDEKIAQMIIYQIDTTSVKEAVLNKLINKNISSFTVDIEDINLKLQITRKIQTNSEIPCFINCNDSLQLSNYRIENSIIDTTILSDFYDFISYNSKTKAINFFYFVDENIFKSDTSIYNLLSKKESRIEISKRIRMFYKALNKQNIISVYDNFNDYYDFDNDSLIISKDILFLINELTSSGLPAIKLNKNIIKDTTIENLPFNHIKKYLETNANFNGLIISEKLINNKNQPSLEETVKAGVDLIIINDNLDETLNNLKDLVLSNVLSEKELNTKVKKILQAKKWSITTNLDSIAIQTIIKKEKPLSKEISYRKVIENSIVLAKNSKSKIPIIDLKYKSFISIEIGEKSLSQLAENMQFYTSVEEKHVTKTSEIKLENYLPYPGVIVSLNNYKIDLEEDSAFLKQIELADKMKNIILVNFLKPENLSYFENLNTIIQVFDNSALTQSFVGQYIFGGISTTAQLPFSISDEFERGTSNTPLIIKRFKYTIPEDAKMSSDSLAYIDTIINENINEKAFPGCVVLVAKDSKIVYYKAFGKQTYDDFRPVLRTDIFDLASITKVAATTLFAMDLYEQNIFKLEDSVKYFIMDTNNLSFKNHQFKDFFTHQSGLQPNMPIGKYLKYRASSDSCNNLYFSLTKDSLHTIQIAENFWFNQSYLDTIKLEMFNLEYDTTKSYKYSDANFNILYEILKPYVAEDFTDYLYQNFYAQLGLQTMGFNPLKRFNKYRIIPTQNDKKWRKQLLRGYVHDESAAINGGVWGNAGLFSNANDLAILFQMLLNEGTYGGKRYFDASTIKLFTAKQQNSERGLGFSLYDYNSFGHTGFTGTCVWTSKDYDLIYILLTNRVHPDMTNKKMLESDTRKRIFDVIINSIEIDKNILTN